MESRSTMQLGDPIARGRLRRSPRGTVVAGAGPHHWPCGGRGGTFAATAITGAFAPVAAKP
jgi:hypothetical protein